MLKTRLDQDREEIDAIDEQLTALFEKRFEIIADIIDYKIENRIPILDSSREEEIIEKNMARIKDDDIRRLYRIQYKNMLALSKQYQEELLKQK